MTIDEEPAARGRLCPLGCGPLTPDDVIYRDNRFNLPHTIRIGWCIPCGLGVTLDPPPREELSRLYAETYASDGKTGRVPRAGGLARMWHKLNGSLPLSDLELQQPILDVGANTGEVLLALRARGIDGIGLEPNPSAVSVARTAGLEMIRGPIESASLPPQHFGSILLSQVLEHVEDPAAVLAVVYGALRMNGTVYIVVPNAHSALRSVFGADWVHWHVPFHLYHYTEDSLAKLCEQCGLHVRRMTNVTPGEWVLMSVEARRNRRRGRYRLVPFDGRYGRRALLAPLGRLLDAAHRGDAIVAEAARSG